MENLGTITDNHIIENSFVNRKIDQHSDTYIALWVLMYYSLEVSYWLTLLLSVLAAGFLVRAFIIL